MIEAQLRVALPTIGRRGRAVGGEAGTCQCKEQEQGGRDANMLPQEACLLWRCRSVEEEQEKGGGRAGWRRRKSVPSKQEEEEERASGAGGGSRRKRNKNVPILVRGIPSKEEGLLRE